MTHGKRYPYAVALNVAEALRTALEPFCERIVIAGSLRRQKPDVGDIELLLIPKVGTRQKDLLDTEQYDRAGEFIDGWLKSGVVAKRPNKNGVFTWGSQNRLAVHVKSGIPLDIFTTTPACWFNALVVRTGPKDSNLLITTTAQKKGYSFEAYGSGFRSLNGHNPYHQTTSERDVFEFIGLPYLEPRDRK